MRYLFGFLCVCALGVVPLVGCGETEERRQPCDWPEDAECDDGNMCTVDECSKHDWCWNFSVDCQTRLPSPYHPDCARAESEVCDPEDQVCGAITYINEGERCSGPNICLGSLGYLCRSGECLCSGCFGPICPPSSFAQPPG
jgi:hypothetical protein